MYIDLPAKNNLCPELLHIQVVTQRKEVFYQAHVPILLMDSIINAHISTFAPLKLDQYIYLFVDNRVTIGQGELSYTGTTVKPATYYTKTSYSARYPYKARRQAGTPFIS